MTIGSLPRRAAEAAGLPPAAAGSSLPAYLTHGRSELEAECRRRYQAAYLGKQTLLCRVLGKYLLFADTADVGIVPHLCLDGYWETWVTQAVARAVRPGWNCVDVGANHGYYTLLLADGVGLAGTVLACEPNPAVADLLEKTLQVNGFRPRARVIREAVADADGAHATLAVPAGFSMNAAVVADAEGGVPVQTVTLDTLCRPLGRVDFIKIDAEGAEERIWHGMQATLARNPAIIVLLEYNASRYRDPRAFLAAIQSAGFPLRHVDYDAQAKLLTAEQVLRERPTEDWMLWLRRG
jgi:FkbM family methyltransferase